MTVYLIAAGVLLVVLFVVLRKRSRKPTAPTGETPTGNSGTRQPGNVHVTQRPR